MSVIIEFHSNY